MTARSLQDRVADVALAADLFNETRTVLSLAAEALSAVVPHALALAFTRRPDGRFGSVAAWLEGKALPRHALQAPTTPIPWVVDVERVPDWQQNRWIEPIGAGIHGKDYFLRDNPLPMRLTGARHAPDYGRAMLCRNGRLLAWMGLYVDGRDGFRDDERMALAVVARQLAAPLRLAALAENGCQPIGLSARQTQVMVRIARGWTNKGIAKDLDISPATVKTFIERLLRLSGAKNRTALAQWWQEGEAATARQDRPHT
jgi:DNA-binding CsgD family transcriptional regulator